MDPSRNFNPSGWKSPEAIRCQVSPASGLSIPPTAQTSPSQVQTAIRFPSGKKSNPVSRIWAFHGFRSGMANVSIAKGPSFLPSVAVVFSTSGQRFGPPWVSDLIARGVGLVFANAVRSSAAPFAISTFTLVGVAAAGMRNTW